MIPAIDFDPRIQRPVGATKIWALANSLRKQAFPVDPERPVEAADIVRLFPRLSVNGRVIDIAWDVEHRVHDADGREVYGVCEIDCEMAGTANVSINGPLLRHRTDLELSTTAHELGHVVFDASAAFAGHAVPARQYRTKEATARAFTMAETTAEWRANEFMGALLVPALALHRRLLAHARAEGLATEKAKSLGHPAWPVVSAPWDPEDLAGVTDVLAQEFGVSPRFISVRLSQYQLISRRRRLGDLR